MRWESIVPLLAVAGSGCHILGPSCQGESGPVFSISGEVAAGVIAVHQVQYGIEGSQNDGQFTWNGQAQVEGPRPQLFATRAECEKFDPKSFEGSPACVPLARAGWADGHLVTSYIITHG